MSAQDESLTRTVVVRGNLVSKTHRFTGNVLPLFLTPVGCVIFAVVLAVVFTYCYKRQRNSRRSSDLSGERLSENNHVVHPIEEIHEEELEESHMSAATPYFQDSSTSSVIGSDDFPLDGNCVICIGAENSSTIEVEVEVHNPPSEIFPVQLVMGKEEFEDTTALLCGKEQESKT